MSCSSKPWFEIQLKGIIASVKIASLFNSPEVRGLFLILIE
jgi:hypothetical protein